jgi:hypothetical protein
MKKRPNADLARAALRRRAGVGLGKVGLVALAVRLRAAALHDA